MILFFAVEGVRANINDKVYQIIDDIGGDPPNPCNPNPNRFADREWLNRFSSMLSESQSAQHGANVYFLVLISLFTAKMLLIFHETDNVHIIPSTMKRAIPSIMYLMVVIFSIISAFAAMAMVCYGHSFARWTRPSKMLMEVYQMMLGDWGDQYEEMYAQSRALAIVLFLFFSIILMMTVVNIFLSVVMDEYDSLNKEDRVSKGLQRPEDMDNDQWKAWIQAQNSKDKATQETDTGNKKEEAGKNTLEQKAQQLWEDGEKPANDKRVIV